MMTDIVEEKKRAYEEARAIFKDMNPDEDNMYWRPRHWKQFIVMKEAEKEYLEVSDDRMADVKITTINYALLIARRRKDAAEMVEIRRRKECLKS